MKNVFLSKIPELAIAVLTYSLCFLSYALVTDDYSWYSFNSAAGQFSNFSNMGYFYYGYIGLNKIIVLLFNILPDYNWLAISFVVFQFAALYLALRAIKQIVLKNISNQHAILAFQILFALFFIENAVFLSHRRFSLIFCGIALFNLAFIADIRKREVIKYSLLFILGMLMGPESSIALLLLVSSGYLIYKFDLKNLFKRFLLPGLATCIMYTAFTIHWYQSTLFITKIEPEIEYKLMDRRVVDISEMKSAADSVRYEAERIGMWFDPKTLTPEFMRSTLLPGLNLNPAHASMVFFHVLSFYKYYLGISWSVAVLLLLSLFQPAGKKRVLQIIIFQIAIFLLTYLIDFNGLLVAGRHFLNFQLIAFLITALFFFNPAVGKFESPNPRFAFGCLLFILFQATLTLINYKQNNNSVLADTRDSELTMQKLESLFSNRLVVVTENDFHLFDHSFTLKNKNYTKNTYITYDMAAYSLTPDYVNYQSALCHCDASDPVAFFYWLSKENALYLSDPYRYDLTERYMKTLYNTTIAFVSPVNLSQLAHTSNNAKQDYEIRSVIDLRQKLIENTKDDRQ